MKTYEICSLPQLRFAHVFQADSYQAHFMPLENCIEVSYVAEGEFTLSINKESHTVKKGDIFCNFYTEDILLDAAGFHSHHTVCASAAFQMFDDDVERLYLPLLTAASADTASIRQIIDQLIYNPASYMGSTAKGAGWFLRLLSEIDLCNRKSNALHLTGEMLYVQKAKNYVRLHINEPITQKEVARYLGISPGYLCSLFQKAEHTSLIQYVNRQKLTEIKILMEQKHLKLNEAASLYGYSDPNYVSRLYKNIFQHNITDRPTKYSGDWQCGSTPSPRPSAHT